MHKKIIAILFCVIIFIGFFNLMINSNDKFTIINFIKYAKTELSFSKNVGKYLEKIYDTIQLSLNKKEIGNFTYYKNEQTGGLMCITKQLDKETIINNANKINILNDVLKQKDISYIYVNMPEEVKDEEILKDIDYGNASSDLLLKNLNNEIHVIDLRKYDKISALKENFYKTDHHWNMETIFAAYQIIMEEIETKYAIEIPSKYYDFTNYKQEVIQNSFFGSKGVNVGENYIKKEDFMVFLPQYSTSFRYQQLNPSGNVIVETEGSFDEALLDFEKLNKSDYINKYNVFLYGGNCENIIINKTSENDKKILLISSSYGRALAPYISQCFSETRYIDPQETRFTKDISDYVEEYNPDIIIMLYTAISNMELINMHP